MPVGEGVSIAAMLRYMFEKGASDLHITPNATPMYRIDGSVVPSEFEVLSEEACQSIIYSILTDEQKEKFERENELDLAFGLQDVGRVRMNVLRQRGTVAAALRAIPSRIPNFEELNLPAVVSKIVQFPKGLVLVTGPTGSGKSTTLAAMIDWINTNHKGHIITIEDPVEFVHKDKQCVIHQREIGSDTKSFTEALRRVLRQDPDVILIGEMRDLETIKAALTIGETGHLVFGTLHTTDTVQTINRVIDVFPPHEQSQVRAQLSFVLQAVLSQQLIPKASGGGRVMGLEVMINTPGIRNLIRESKLEQVYTALQTGAELGMQPMNRSLYDHYMNQMITFQEAMLRSMDPKDLQRMIKGN